MSSNNGKWLFLAGLLIGILGTLLLYRPAKIIETRTEYIPGPVISVSRDSSEIKPISSSLAEPLQYAHKVQPSEPSPEIGPNLQATEPISEPSDSLLETVKDWNTKRKYSETLIDSDTVGKAKLDITVQYNRITGYAFNFTPVNRVQTIIQSPPIRLQGYMLGNVTNTGAQIGLGLKYKNFGIHALGGYDYISKKQVYGGGLMVVF